MSEDLRQMLIALAAAAILGVVAAFMDEDEPADKDTEAQIYEEDEFDQ